MESGVWHSVNIQDVYAKLSSNAQGLTSAEAAKRLQRYGRNALKEQKKKSALKIFVEQFNSFLIWILFGTVIITFAFQHYVDAIVILVILLLNAVVGFFQEYNAEKSLEALKKLAALKTTVLRDGKEECIDASIVVPGDIVLLEEGAQVPADCRLIQIKELSAQEAALTGESNPVSKDINPVPADSILADMTNMVFSGTTITRGRGKAIVTGTGQQTQIGKIAQMLGEMDDIQTPLQRSMQKLGKQIGFIVIIICIIIFLTGYFFQQHACSNSQECFIEMLMASVSLAVAAIPEGLAAVVTISLALGVKRMVKKNALIRKLSSIETLGCTTIICTDKTGTLTHNEMTVRKIFANGMEYDVTGQGYAIQGDFMQGNSKVSPAKFELLLRIGVLCNNAKLNSKNPAVIGDPTEGALLVSAAKAGMIREPLEKLYPRTDEILFDSARKCMSTVHIAGKEAFIYTKGAPEHIVSICDRILVDGKVRKLTPRDRAAILQKNTEFAGKALRVLGFAFAKAKGRPAEKDLVFVGLQAMIDPPRAEAKVAIDRCRTAGIKVVMITGDNELTALAIAKELGIEGKAMTGRELDKASNLTDIVESISIFARVNPEHKMHIVKALQDKGHIVAMTGDGVNDAPAIKKADIGIAMGITGTDVAKESSKMVLLDDNFVSIVNAVEEGRGIYANIRKFVYYLLSCNMGEVLTIFLAIMLMGLIEGLELPLIALQILWMNLITDGLPALALGIDPIDKDVMNRKPRKSTESIMTRWTMLRMMMIALVMSIVTLSLFIHYNRHSGFLHASTVAFTALVMLQLFNVLNTHCERTVFSKEIFNNKYLILAIFGSIFLQIFVIYSPLSEVFKTFHLSAWDWILIVIAASSVIFIEELRKLTARIAGKSEE